VRTYRPTRGLIVGAVGVAAALIVGLVALIGSPSRGSAEFCLALMLFAWAAWVVLLRPCVRLDERDVHVVGSLTTVEVPAEAIEHVTVRQYLSIDAGSRTYTCAGIGNSRRTLGRATQEPLRGLVVEEGGRTVIENQAERVRELIDQAARAARRRPRDPLPAIVRTWDRLPIGLLVGLLAALACVAVVG